MRFQILLVLFSTFIYTECSNILFIFYMTSKSHIILGQKLAEGLVQKGHHITFISPFDGDQMENCTYITLKKNLENRDKNKEKIFSPNIGLIKMFLHMTEFMHDNTIFFWEDPNIQKMIKEKPKFDAMILINFGTDSYLGLAHHLGIPVILFNPVGTTIISNKYYGNPNMVYTRNTMAGFSPDGFFGRLGTTTANALMNLYIDVMFQSFEEDTMRKYLPDSPPLKDLQKNIALMLLNSHVSIEPARPYLPNMIQIGGYHMQNVKELPADIKTHLDDAKEGAILFSMGSNVQISSFGKENVDGIMNVFKELAPMKVIFKSELTHENLPDNVMVRKWLPQSDILAHPNVKVFIAHGGLGGNIESVYHGVPILGIPFFGDQRNNLEEAKAAGYGLMLDFKDLTEVSFRENLKEILYNPKYSINVKKRSGLMKEQPVKPMDNAIFWVEHVIKYKSGSHLRNAGMDLEWYQLYMLDIYVFYTILLVVLSAIQFYIVKCLIKLGRRMFKKTENKIKTS